MPALHNYSACQDTRSTKARVTTTSVKRHALLSCRRTRTHIEQGGRCERRFHWTALASVARSLTASRCAMTPSIMVGADLAFISWNRLNAGFALSPERKLARQRTKTETPPPPQHTHTHNLSRKPYTSYSSLAKMEQLVVIWQTTRMISIILPPPF